MTGPTDDLIQGAVKYLLAFPDVTTALTTYPDGTPWLFQHTLWAELEGSGGTAAVISRAGGWAAPNTYNTARFPRIALDIWADPIRDAANHVTDPGEVQRRADAAYQILDAHLHNAAAGDRMWGTVRTITCVRLAEPNVYTVPDGDGLLRLETFYGITQA
jgi:hypothetical protein